jgi:hypothetical protein
VVGIILWVSSCTAAATAAATTTITTSSAALALNGSRCNDHLWLGRRYLLEQGNESLLALGQRLYLTSHRVHFFF